MWSEEQYPSLFLSHQKYGNLVVDEVGRKWFESRVEEWVQFCEVELQNAEQDVVPDRSGII
jgi:hypothetical protein